MSDYTYNSHNNEIDDLAMAVSGGKLSDLNIDTNSVIMVIGVGGAGGNAVNHMQDLDISGVNFVVCNTDKQALENCRVSNKIKIGPGLGAGNDPERGRKLALESEEQLRDLLDTSGVRMLFIAAGMGGGTGTGASPVIAKIAHELNILTVAVVTMPLVMEGTGRFNNAVKGLNELNKYVDSLIIIENERVREQYGNLPLREAFGRADDVLGMATKGIAELITVDWALVRVDFADVEKVMRGSGRAHMSVVKKSGENRALEAAKEALESSLIDDNHISGAKSILLSYSVKDINTLTHDDITVAMKYIQECARYKDENGDIHMADIIWGASQKHTLEDDELEIVVVATGFADGNELKIKTEYVNPDFDSPFEETKTEEKVEEPAVEEAPQVDKTPAILHQEPVVITAPKDRYKNIATQKREPAYVRNNATFLDESENTATTTFQPARRNEQEESVELGGSLFQN